MLTKLINYLTPNYPHLKNRTVFLILFFVSFFIRLPFFFRDYIDRDESTFILMGQSWVNGHLPYLELWDLKPPMNFLFFAGIIYFFGKSMIAIRFFGVLIVAITAWYTYSISNLVNSKKIGFWCAIFCVFLQSLFGSMQGVMSEHISVLFFMPALYFLIKYKEWYWFLLAGLLMGLSTMVKLNMAYPIALIGLYLSYGYIIKKHIRTGFLNMMMFSIGVITIILCAILPYYLQGNFDLWWDSVIQAPLLYSNYGRSSILIFLPLLLFLALFLWLARKKNYINFKTDTIQLLTVAIIGIVLSFIKGGRLNGHYLIQLYPSLLILVFVFISAIPSLKRATYKPLFALLLLLIPMESYLEYVAILKNKIDKGTFYNGEGIEVPRYISANNLDYTNILFTEYHIGYWYLGTNPPSKTATHPSNTSRPELFQYAQNPRKTVMEEIQFILEVKQPQLIVARQGDLLLFDTLIDENIYVNHYLKQYYQPIKTIGKAIIYQRLK
ncbi:glycosyltransferase family 39 protein [Cellulophaga sp. Hel_I_12]|uniref:ArnT family glycosyltransferase n=1 Tax=Cellulophaga sp. Hel_I_12 TaxID=1249972 RepID=UPI000647A0BD|nr:glycosyltransferase family 39 protein [Cellulophaga sp. Hel_I_12]